MITDTVQRWLVAEFCANALYNGWHLYLRDSHRFKRNADGDWGWLERGHHLLPAARAVLAEIGIQMRPGVDGSCDDDGYAELARRYPIRGRRRGGVLVLVDSDSLTLVSRQRFVQHDRWFTNEALHASSVYSDRLCCYCARLVRSDATRLRTARTNDGEWWLIGPGVDLAAPEWRDFQDQLDGTFAPTLLPVGPDCLRQHPEWRFAVAAPEATS